MKKIAGITWWKNNYGSILQACALSRVLDSIDGCQYEVVKQFSLHAFSFKMLAMRIKKQGLTRTLAYAFNKFSRRELRERIQKCELFVSKHIKVSEKLYDFQHPEELADAYDIFVCGSDQIWNPGLTSRNSIYWLNIPGAKHKIAYAPSLGITSADDQLRAEIAAALNDFKAVSCRENAGSALINDILGAAVCKTVLDPTLLLSRSEWDEIAVNPSIGKPYVFAYILCGTDADREMIRDFAKQQNKTLVTIPFLEADHINKKDRLFGDRQITNADPGQFIGLIQHADYVFTDSFHCMVFSCIYHKSFFSLNKIGKNQMLRIQDFQSWMGIGNRVITSESDVQRLLQTDDYTMWETFERRLKEERTNSMQFLMNALNDTE